jgi:hypothetical protein
MQKWSTVQKVEGQNQETNSSDGPHGEFELVFSVTAAHFLAHSLLENLCLFDPSKRDPKLNKTSTYN